MASGMETEDIVQFILDDFHDVIITLDSRAGSSS